MLCKETSIYSVQKTVQPKKAKHEKEKTRKRKKGKAKDYKGKAKGYKGKAKGFADYASDLRRSDYSKLRRAAESAGKPCRTAGSHRLSEGWDKKPLDLAKLKTDKVPLWAFSCYTPTQLAYSSCGSTALSLLTGIDPFVIANANDEYNRKYKIAYGTTTTEYMIAILKAYDFRVYELTLHDLCPEQKVILSTLDSKHLLVIGSWVAKKEQTWQVVFGNRIYHNLTVATETAKEYLCHPATTILLLVPKKKRHS